MKFLINKNVSTVSTFKMVNIPIPLHFAIMCTFLQRQPGILKKTFRNVKGRIPTVLPNMAIVHGLIKDNFNVEKVIQG